jgi:uncharacterized protein
MVELRVDPWAPERGMGFEAAIDETPATADPFVESSDWTRPRAVPPAEPGLVWFVDGVRRIELRLVVSDGGRRPFGLFGSTAVGAVRCDGRASFGAHHIGRWLVVGGGVRADPVELDIGPARMRYEPLTEPGSDANAPVDGLHKAMQAAEANLASRIAADGTCVVLADGRLGFLDPTASPVVGIVKRFVRAYLDPDQDRLLPRLGVGERSPLFGLVYEGQPLERYAWYTRLAPGRSEWHDHAGLVRCEVRAGVGLGAAGSIADRVTALLPSFTGRSTDPRFPQNLAPVTGLESWLQHRMGHRGIVRRALTARLVDARAESGAESREGS